MRTALLGLALLGLVGCKSPDKAALDCAAVTKAALARLRPELMTKADGNLIVAAAVLESNEIFANRCRDDKWSTAALTCIQAATGRDGFEKCKDEHLSKQQSDQLLQDIGALGTSPEERAVLAKMTSMKDQMCQCSDSQCVEKVQQGLTAWSLEMAVTERRQPKKMKDRVAKQVTALSTELTQCAGKATAGSTDRGSAGSETPASQQPVP